LAELLGESRKGEEDAQVVRGAHMSPKFTPPLSPPLPTIENRPLHASAVGSQSSNWTCERAREEGQRREREREGDDRIEAHLGRVGRVDVGAEAAEGGQVGHGLRIGGRGSGRLGGEVGTGCRGRVRTAVSRGGSVASEMEERTWVVARGVDLEVGEQLGCEVPQVGARRGFDGGGSSAASECERQDGASRDAHGERVRRREA